MHPTRRGFCKLAATLPVAALLPNRALAAPNSKFAGVQIGTITYSFKQDVKKPDEIIPDLVKIWAQFGRTNVGGWRTHRRRAAYSEFRVWRQANSKPAGRRR